MNTAGRPRKRRNTGRDRSSGLLAMSERDLYWLAGWAEGEACFSTLPQKGWLYPRIAVGSTDLETLQRAQKITGVGTITERTYVSKGKRMYVWTVNKTVEAADLMRVLLPLMGDRRRDAILQTLAASNT